MNQSSFLEADDQELNSIGTRIDDIDSRLGHLKDKKKFISSEISTMTAIKGYYLIQRKMIEGQKLSLTTEDKVVVFGSPSMIEAMKESDFLAIEPKEGANAHVVGRFRHGVRIDAK